MPIWRPIPADELASSKSEISVGDKISPAECEALAIKVALAGAGNVSPNPMVGAVAVDAEHRFLASGAHLAFGEGHAEANLLAELKSKGNLDSLKGATIYVTFEPCAHSGKTPSCARTLSEYPLKKIIYALPDPNPMVDGKGLAIIKDAGIECEQSQNFADQAKFLTDTFSWQIKNKSPFFGLKAATSADGVFAKSDSQKFWITSERSRTFGHWLRYLYDGIMVGSGTVIADNPKLDARHPSFKSRQPKKIVFDPKGHALEIADLASLSLFDSIPNSVAWISHESVWKSLSDSKSEILDSKCVERISLKTGIENSINTNELVEKISELGLRSILLEGGAGLWRTFLEMQIVNKVHLFQSAKLFGGSTGRNWLEKLEVESPFELCNTSLTFLGDDWLLEGDLPRRDF